MGRVDIQISQGNGFFTLIFWLIIISFIAGIGATFYYHVTDQPVPSIYNEMTCAVETDLYVTETPHAKFVRCEPRM